MKQIAFVLIALFPLSALGQGEIDSVETDLKVQVSQIAALVVENTDGIESLRDQVAGIAAQTENNKTLIQELLERVSQLEGRAIALPELNRVVPQPPAVRSAVRVASSPIVAPAPAVVYSRTRTVTRTAPQVRTYRTPVRSFLGNLFRRNVTGSSVGSWTFPGDIYSHLAGPPHYVDASALSYSQAVQLHNRLHGG